MNKPKVLHIVTHIIGGGAEKNTIDTVKGLAELGYEVHLMSGRDVDHSVLRRMKWPSNIRLIIIPELARNINPVKEYIAYRKIRKCIEREKYQIVHTHMAKASVLGRLAAKRAGVPCIIYGLHGMLFPKTSNIMTRMICRRIESYCGGFTDRFVVVGEDLKEKYILAGIGEHHKYHVIHTGIDVDQFYAAKENSKEKILRLKKEIGIDKEDVVVGMVTRFDKNKGIEYFIQLVRNVGDRLRNVKFVIVGNGRDLERQKKYAKKISVLNNIVFTGYRNDVADVISLFDVAVLTSMREGLSQFLVQAAMIAKPIVTFDVDGAWEVVKEGQNGFIIPTRDLGSLSDRICQLVCDEMLRVKMGQKSSELIGNSRTVENMVTKINELYQNYID